MQNFKNFENRNIEYFSIVKILCNKAKNYFIICHLYAYKDLKTYLVSLKKISIRNMQKYP